MAKVIEAVQRYRKIEDVTSPKDDAPPVYLMDEIADIAKTSSDSAESVAEHINKRLGHKSAVVKWKALRLTKHLCTKGCSQFQRNMQKYSGSIRELIQYRGEPDAFKGDTLNQRVRELAKEATDSIYASNAAHHSSSASGMQGRIQGFGGNIGGSGAQHGVAGPPAGSMGSKMMGFGSAEYSHTAAPAAPSALSSVSDAVNTISNNIGGFIRNQLPTRSEHASLHMRNGSSSSMGDGGYMPTASGPSGHGPSFHTPSSYQSSTPSSFHTTAANVLGSEEQLVEDICAPGGIRASPDPEDLRKFVETASSMDGLRIAELLRAKLASPSWHVVLRALSALEAVLQQGMTAACGEIAVMFQSDPSVVRNSLSSPQQSVRERAARCLKLLVNEDVQLPSMGSKKSSTANLPTAGSFQDLLAPSSPAHKIHAPQPQASPLDLLGDVGVPPPAAPAAASHDPFLQLNSFVPQVPYGAATTSAPSQPAQFTPAGTSADPFASFTPATAAPAPASNLLGGSLGPAPTSTASTSQTSNVMAPLDDFFASLSVSGGQIQVGPSGAAPARPQAPQNPAYGAMAGNQFGMPAMNSAPAASASFGMTPGYGGAPGMGAPPPGAMGGGYQMPNQMQSQWNALGGGPGAPAAGYNSGMGGMGVPGNFGAAGMVPAVAKPAGVGYMPAGSAAAGSAWGSKPQASQDSAFDFVKDVFK